MLFTQAGGTRITPRTKPRNSATGANLPIFIWAGEVHLMEDCPRIPGSPQPDAGASGFSISILSILGNQKKRGSWLMLPSICCREPSGLTMTPLVLRADDPLDLDASAALVDRHLGHGGDVRAQVDGAGHAHAPSAGRPSRLPAPAAYACRRGGSGGTRAGTRPPWPPGCRCAIRARRCWY